jgi:hypothetical protein
MNDELENIWKEMMVTYSKHYPGVCLEGLREITITSVRISGTPIEFRIEYRIQVYIAAPKSSVQSSTGVHLQASAETGSKFQLTTSSFFCRSPGFIRQN